MQDKLCQHASSLSLSKYDNVVMQLSNIFANMRPIHVDMRFIHVDMLHVNKHINTQLH